MKIKALKKILHLISNAGYGDWILFMCDDDDDDYTINHIYRDDDGDICLKSTDMEGDNYDFTANNVLKRINKYNNEDYVYFLEEYWDGSWNTYDIKFNWYIGWDDSGDPILNIDCYDDDDDYDDYDDDDDDDGDNNDDGKVTESENRSSYDCESSSDDNTDFLLDLIYLNS